MHACREVDGGGGSGVSKAKRCADKKGREGGHVV